jgi:hypothetical protein
VHLHGAATMQQLKGEQAKGVLLTCIKIFLGLRLNSLVGLWCEIGQRLAAKDPLCLTPSLSSAVGMQ